MSFFPVGIFTDQCVQDIAETDIVMNRWSTHGKLVGSIPMVVDVSCLLFNYRIDFEMSVIFPLHLDPAVCLVGASEAWNRVVAPEMYVH
jgi:hypothetical protein